MKNYEEFDKIELLRWIKLCDKFFDEAGVPATDTVCAAYSIYGRLTEYAKDRNEAISEFADRIEKLEAALRKIASGDGVYGQQAAEYKQIAKDALGDAC